jgi:hypothetical protein
MQESEEGKVIDERRCKDGEENLGYSIRLENSERIVCLKHSDQK